MATNGTPQAFAPGEVLQAMQTMRGSDTDKKKKAHEYLESFQKSVGFLFFSPFTFLSCKCQAANMT